MRSFIIFFILPALFISEAIASNAELFYVSGIVKLTRDNETVKASKGMEILEGDQLETNTTSFAIIRYANKSTFKLDPKSHLIIDELHFNVEGKKSTSLVLKAGALMIDFFNPDKDKAIQVKVRDVAMAVRGTHFVAAIDDNEERDVYLIVREGTVNLYNFESDDYEQVSDGFTSIVKAGKLIKKPTEFKWIKTLNWQMRTQEPSGKASFFNKFIKSNRKNEIKETKSKWEKRIPRSIKNDQPKEYEKRKLRSNRIKNKKLIRKMRSEIKQTKLETKKIKQKALNKIAANERMMKNASPEEKVRLKKMNKAIIKKYNAVAKKRNSVIQKNKIQSQSIVKNINKPLTSVNDKGQVVYSPKGIVSKKTGAKGIVLKSPGPKTKQKYMLGNQDVGKSAMANGRNGKLLKMNKSGKASGLVKQPPKMRIGKTKPAVNLNGATIKPILRTNTIAPRSSTTPLKSTTLSGTNLSGSTITKSTLSGTTLSGATLTGTKLTTTTLSGATLTGTKLTTTSLSGDTTTSSKLTTTTLSGTKITDTSIKTTSLDGSIVTKDTLTKTTSDGDLLTNSTTTKLSPDGDSFTKTTTSTTNDDGASISKTTLSKTSDSGETVSKTVMSKTNDSGQTVSKAIFPTAATTNISPTGAKLFKAKSKSPASTTKVATNPMSKSKSKVQKKVPHGQIVKAAVIAAKSGGTTSKSGVGKVVNKVASSKNQAPKANTSPKNTQPVTTKSQQQTTTNQLTSSQSTRPPSNQAQTSPNPNSDSSTYANKRKQSASSMNAIERAKATRPTIKKKTASSEKDTKSKLKQSGNSTEPKARSRRIARSKRKSRSKRNRSIIRSKSRMPASTGTSGLPSISPIKSGDISITPSKTVPIKTLSK